MGNHFRTLNKISILSFNILAESWFSNHLYDKEIICELDRYFPIDKRNKSSDRIKTVKSYLDKLINTNSYDVICLQETENYFNDYLVSKYSNDYKIFFVYHDNLFWLSDINPDIRFYPNGVTTMIKKHKFKTIDFSDIKLDIGNHSILTKCIDYDNNKINIINAHLDIEDETNINEYYYFNKLKRGRYTELAHIIKIINKNSADFNFVVGDLNDGLHGYATKKFLLNNNYIDLFKLTNNLLNTYPYISRDNNHTEQIKTPKPYSILDKIFLKTGRKFICKKTMIHNKYNKIIYNLLKTGSDHYAIDAIIIY